jgi:lactate dehydrogenase-like 2-hydroxyacid dehydrogenase
MGKIGFRVAEKAAGAFGMKVLYHDIRRLPGEVEEKVGAEFFERLEDMLAVADCTLVATPFGGSKVLSAPQIGMMKQGSRLVNIARGKLIDEDALVEALESGRLFAVGLDVHYDEPVVDARLRGMRNTELLSHTAGASVDSHVGFERLGMENILSWLETGRALTAVNEGEVGEREGGKERRARL